MTPPTTTAKPGNLDQIAKTYSDRLARYGATANGVFWRNAEGQWLRFEKLIGVIDPCDSDGGITINDLGCGYGALFEVLWHRGFMQHSCYVGYDICRDMLHEARLRVTHPRAQFINSAVATMEADYSLVSGTFNMKLDADDKDWAHYVEASLIDLWSKTRKGLAFNMLSRSRRLLRQGDLYYADWRRYEAFCLGALSPNVTVLRDYPLAEWTIYVHRRDS